MTKKAECKRGKKEKNRREEKRKKMNVRGKSERREEGVGEFWRNKYFNKSYYYLKKS